MTEPGSRQARVRGFLSAVVMAVFCGIFVLLSQGPVFRVVFIVLGVLALAGGTVTLITGRGTGEPKKGS